MEQTAFAWAQVAISVLGLVVLVLILFLILVLVVTRTKKTQSKVKIEVKKINESYKNNKDKILQAVLTPEELKKSVKTEKEIKKQNLKKTSVEQIKKRLFVLDFQGDIAASAVTAFREQITALLQVVTPADEVVVRIESPGGHMHAYGLAASQLARIRAHNIPLTVCVDKVAASGGYMMACLADKIIAAPFAILGSIGVVASMPNVNKLLRKYDVDYLEMTAGEYKRTLTPFGEVTDKGKAKFQEQIDEAHVLFKEHVKRYRDVVDIDTVATGDHWFGLKALEHKLVDAITTSDDYLLAASKDCAIYQVYTAKKENLRDKLTEMFNTLLVSVLQNFAASSRFLK